MGSIFKDLDVSVGVLVTGVPRLACLRPTAWLHRRPGTAQLQHQQHKTLTRGQASRSRQRQDPRGDRPPQAGSRGAESSMQGLPHEAQLTRAMTTKARRAPRGHRAQVSYSVQRRQATGMESRGISQRFPSGAMRPRPQGRQDEGHHRAHRSVTTMGYS